MIAGPSFDFFGAGAALAFFGAVVALAFLGAVETLVFFMGEAASFCSSIESSVLMSASTLRFLEAWGADSVVLRLLAVAEFMSAFCESSQDDVDSPGLDSTVFLGAAALAAFF